VNVICRKDPKVTPIRLSAEFSRNLAGQERVAKYIHSAESKKNFQPRILCLERLSFKIEGEVKSFLDK